jgi:hypothetical protein
MRTPVRLTTAGAVLALAVALLCVSGVRVALAGVDGDLVLDSFISQGACEPGTTNCAGGSTGVTSQGGGLTWRAEDGDGLTGFSRSGNTGVLGFSQGTCDADHRCTGVSGSGPQLGVDGVGLVGVHGNGQGEGGVGLSGEGGQYGVYATGGEIGVYGLGLTSDGVHGEAGDGAAGVYGRNFGSGSGVRGQSAEGTGVLAQSAHGTALRVGGKAQFTRSGKATVAGTAAHPRSSVVVSGIGLSGTSMVLATPQRNVAGVFVQAAVPAAAANTITITLNKPVSAAYPVAWMVIERP